MKGSVKSILKYLWEYIFCRLIVGPDVCNCSRNLLVCEKNNCLTIKKDTSQIVDMYYIKRGGVCSVINTFSRKKIQCYMYFRGDVVAPKAYFEIAEQLHLEVDRETYIRLLLIWMEKLNTCFYKNIPAKHLPIAIPTHWGDVEEEVNSFYLNVWNNSDNQTESGSYADFFRICNMGCFITGNGKSRTCRLIMDEELVIDAVKLKRFDNIIYATAGGFGGSVCLNEVHYCIHMLSEDKTVSSDIIEVDLVQYLVYAERFIIKCASVMSFFNTLKNSNVRYILVPWCKSQEEKAELIKQYLIDHPFV